MATDSTTYTLQKKKELGEGSFGEVFQVKGAQDYALKLLKCSGESVNMADFSKEWQILSGLDHPNIIKVYRAGYVQSDASSFIMSNILAKGSQFGILLELCTTDLFKQLKVRNKDKVEKVWNLFVFRQMVEGVKYLHSKAIIHRDIKPANVLLNTNNSVKLTDFGLSKGGVFSAAAENTKDLGTSPYMAPEVRKGKKYDKSVDVYAMGITLLEMFTTRKDFFDWYESLPLESEPEEYDTSLCKHKMDDALAKVFTQMTHHAPAKRPALDQIVEKLTL